jgi:hypothetical protein
MIPCLRKVRIASSQTLMQRTQVATRQFWYGKKRLIKQCIER